MNAVYGEAWIGPERRRVVSVVVASFYECGVSAGCKYLDEEVGVGDSVEVLIWS